MRLYKRKARHDIYQYGERLNADNKQGFTRDRSKPTSNPHLQDEEVIIRKGQEYYTWHPKGFNWQYSLKKPDLRSDWEKELVELGDEVDNFMKNRMDEEEEETNYDDYLRTKIEERKDELQTNLDNMPEQLQESSVLNERIEALQELLDQL